MDTTHNMTCRLARLAALAHATVEQMHAATEHEDISPDSSIMFGIELGMVLKAEIAELRRQVAMEETARLVRRVAA